MNLSRAPDKERRSGDLFSRDQGRVGIQSTAKVRRPQNIGCGPYAACNYTADRLRFDHRAMGLVAAKV